MSDTAFKKTRAVYIGGMGITRRIGLGGGEPVAIQTMWKEPLIPFAEKEKTTLEALDRLSAMGCSLTRFAVPDAESAEALIKLSRLTSMPLVADIHFDYKLALRCLDGNIAKIRINPGNIGVKEKVDEVLRKARDRGAVIRIGVNAGSLPKDLQKRFESGEISRASAALAAAERELEFCDRVGFSEVVASIKTSSARETISANELFASKYDYPLHIGVTEAGPAITGSVKSAIALHRLLTEGIGSTVRVSLSDEPENEVIAAKAILRESGLPVSGVTLISCPRCGRPGFDVRGFIRRWEKKLAAMQKNITVAVMGCVVNGPGEAKHADIGITGVGNKIYIFRGGDIVKTASADETDSVFEEELQKL